MYIQRTIETLLPGILATFPCLADGERPISRGVTAIGVEDYLRRLQQRLAA